MHYLTSLQAIAYKKNKYLLVPQNVFLLSNEHKSKTLKEKSIIDHH